MAMIGGSTANNRGDELHNSCNTVYRALRAVDGPHKYTCYQTNHGLETAIEELKFRLVVARALNASDHAAEDTDTNVAPFEIREKLVGMTLDQARKALSFYRARPAWGAQQWGADINYATRNYCLKAVELLGEYIGNLPNYQMARFTLLSLQATLRAARDINLFLDGESRFGMDSVVASTANALSSAEIAV